MPESRLLQLLALLQARRDWAGGELADRLGVSCRTVRRDVERLRELGYPVGSVTGPTGGYRLSAGTAMPPLLLDDDEAIAIAVGLRTAARASVAGIEETAIRALVKLEQVLPAHLRRRVSAFASTMTAPPFAAPMVEPQHLMVIAAACRDGECLRFAYRSRDGTTSRRLVEPHTLVNLGRRWYLVAWDRDRTDWRTFRVDRLSRPASAGGRVRTRPLPARDAAAYIEQSIATAPHQFEARITLHAPAEQIARRFPHAAATVRPIDKQTCEFRTGDDNLAWLALRITMLDVDFEVHEPPELTKHLEQLAERFRRGAAARAGETRVGRPLRGSRATRPQADKRSC
jgi:predicted DNA-binding transcriptional regulator YafY